MKRKVIIKTIFSGIALLCLIPFQNCAEQDQEFSQMSTELSNVLVYGESDSDQQMLAQKISGYERPGLDRIYRQWGRISGPTYYQRESDIVPESNYAFCFTEKNVEGYWASFIDPATGRRVSNDTYNGYNCIDSHSFAAASWSYVDSVGGLRNTTNINFFSGFISAVPFHSYENEAVITSAAKDDDVIALIIATLTDSQGRIHTLTAVRSHGGGIPGLDRGWGFVYFVNGLPQRVFHNVSVDGVSMNTTPGGSGDPAGTGWSNKKSFIKVTRTRDSITALASNWFTGGETAVLNPASRIEINLNDPANGLQIFRGAQKYGYGSFSQVGATFLKIKFNSLVDDKYVYDLKNNLVYQLIEDGSGRYELVNRMSAFKQLGVNLHVVNPETQKAFFLWNKGRYKEVDGDNLDEIPNE